MIEDPQALAELLDRLASSLEAAPRGSATGAERRSVAADAPLVDEPEPLAS
jgi:hypothetical protein